MNKRCSGFTLIELMIVVVIAGILAAIAYPAYQDSVRKSRRADAKTALLDLKLAQEKFRANCVQYSPNLLDADGTNDTPDAVTCDNTTMANSDLGYGSNTTSQGFYTLAITASSATGFTATATAQGDQVNDTGCTIFTLTVNAGDETLTPTACL